MADAGVSLEELFAQIEKAISGDRALRAQLFRTMQKLSRHPQATPEDREIGRILARVLAGDRSPDLSALPQALAGELAVLLERLGQK